MAKCKLHRGVRNVCGKSKIWLLFLIEPTVRTLRLLSCPRRFAPLQRPTSEPKASKSCAATCDENANPVIAVDPHMIDIRDRSVESHFDAKAAAVN